MCLLKESKERTRFLRYATVGAFGALVDFSVLNLLTSIFKMSSVYASVFSFIAAVISNFSWNRLWTFPESRSKKVSKQIMQFAMVSVIGLLIRTPVFAYLESLFTDIFTSMSVNLLFEPNVVAQNLALALVIGIVMVWNFVVNRFWTFSDVD